MKSPVIGVVVMWIPAGVMSILARVPWIPAGVPWTPAVAEFNLV